MVLYVWPCAERRGAFCLKTATIHTDDGGSTNYINLKKLKAVWLMYHYTNQPKTDQIASFIVNYTIR